MKKMLKYTLIKEKMMRLTHVDEELNDFLSSFF